MKTLGYKKSTWAALGAAGFVLTPMVSQAAMVMNLDATQDALVRFNSTGTDDTRLIVGNNTFNGPLRGLLAFDVSGLGAGSTINSVTLTLTTRSDGNATGFTINLTEVVAFDTTPTFLEIDATPTLNEAFGATLSSTTVNPTIDGTTTFGTSASFQSYVQSALDGSGTVFFALEENAEANGPTDANFTQFDAIGESDAVVARLSVDFTAVPEPSSTALLGLGGLALLLRRRK